MVKPPCSVDGCDTPAKARQLCPRHYQRWRKHGDLTRGRRRAGVCVIEGCNAPRRGRGWCRKHYERHRKYGDPTMTTRVFIPAGTICTIEGCERPAALLSGLCKQHYHREYIARRVVTAICSVPGCERPVRNRRLCNSHYTRWLRLDTLDQIHVLLGHKTFSGRGKLTALAQRRVEVPEPPSGCSVEGCDHPHKARGYCRIHYERRRTGRDMRGVEQARHSTPERHAI